MAISKKRNLQQFPILQWCISLLCHHQIPILKTKQIHAFSLRHGVALTHPTFCKHLIYTIISSSSSSSPSSILYASNIFNLLKFPTTFTYNTIIRGYAQTSSSSSALLLYSRMHSTSTPPDTHTFPFLLKAVAKSMAISAGEQTHSIILKTGFSSLVFVNNSLLYMYSSCGFYHNAYLVFRHMPEKDIVSWNSVINGFVINSRPNEALTLFKQMAAEEGVEPDEFTLLSLVNSCTELGALALGRRVHLYMFKLGVVNTHGANSLLNFYSKCGNMRDAVRVFEEMKVKNIVSWNSVIVGLAVNGLGREAIEVFQELESIGKEYGFLPTDITFVGVLYACAHCGMVEKGKEYMEKMKGGYGIVPRMEHYGCMVDLLGRVGLVKEAYEFVKKMEVKPSVVIWRILLGACGRHGYLDLGKEVGRRIEGIEEEEEEEGSGDYIMLSNLYALREEWGEVGGIRRRMRGRKKPGVSMVEVGNRVYEFVRGGGKYVEVEKICEKVREMSRRVGEEGYKVCTRNVYVDVEEEEKEEALVYHSEKMAVAFVEMNTAEGTPIRVTKNLRICGDCHLWIKIVSKVFRREIVVRDGSRFHHFSCGSCSCNDFW